MEATTMVIEGLGIRVKGIGFLGMLPNPCEKLSTSRQAPSRVSAMWTRQILQVLVQPNASQFAALTTSKHMRFDFIL